MFHAEYSSGSPLRMLVDLRNVVDAALARSNKKAARLPSAPAPAVARQGSSRRRHNLLLPARKLPEFEVTAAPEWDQDSSAPHEPGDDDKV